MENIKDNYQTSLEWMSQLIHPKIRPCNSQRNHPTLKNYTDSTSILTCYMSVRLEKDGVSMACFWGVSYFFI